MQPLKVCCTLVHKVLDTTVGTVRFFESTADGFQGKNIMDTVQRAVGLRTSLKGRLARVYGA